MGVTSHGRKYLSAGLPGTGIVYRHYQRQEKPIPVYRPMEHAIVEHPAHTIGWYCGYITGLIVYFGIPLALIGWILSFIWRATH